MCKEKKAAQRIAQLLREIAQEIESLADLSMDLDIYQIFQEEGEEALKEKLGSLDLPTLKKIIADHGFDPAKVAVKWRKKEKLVNFILEKLNTVS